MDEHDSVANGEVLNIGSDCADDAAALVAHSAGIAFYYAQS